LHTEAFTHRSFYRQLLSHTVPFTQGSLCIYRAALTRRSIYTEKPLHTDALHTDVFTQERFYTEQLSHINSFTQRSFYTEEPLYRAAFTQKHLHREAFTQGSFSTFPHRRFVHKAAFTHRSFYTGKALRRAAFTHRSIYKEKLLHRVALHTELHTGTFTPDAYRQRQLLHTAASTHRRFDTPFRQTPFKAVQTGPGWLRHGSDWLRHKSDLFRHDCQKLVSRTSPDVRKSHVRIHNGLYVNVTLRKRPEASMEGLSGAMLLLSWATRAMLYEYGAEIFIS